MKFNYNKLRYIIMERIGTQKELAEMLGYSAAYFSQKMSGNRVFTQTDIVKIRQALHLTSEELDECFFTIKKDEKL